MSVVCLCIRFSCAADSYSGSDGVAIAAYNDPKTLNSLSPNLQAETFVVLEHAARDPDCKVYTPAIL